MKVLSADDGRGLRQRVVAALQASDSLWSEYKRRKPWRWRLDIRTQRLLALLLAAGPMTLSELLTPADGDAGPRRLTSIFVALVCGRALTLGAETWDTLYSNAEFGMTYYFPIRAEDYFQHQIRKILYRSLWVPLLGVIFYAALSKGTGLAAWLVAPIAALHWLVFFALSLLALRYGQKYFGLNRLPGYVFYALALLMFLSEDKSQQAMMQFQSIAVALPPAWIDAAFQFAAVGNRSLAALLVLPCVALAASAAWNFAWLKKTFLDAVVTVAPRPAMPTEADEIPKAEDDRTVWTRARAELQGLQTAQSIENGALAQRVDWNARGPVERCAALWFTARERTVAEFLLGEHVGWWTERWKQSALVAAIVIAGALGGFAPLPLLVFGATVSMVIGCPLLGGYWIAFTSVRAGAMTVPMIALFPAGYHEVSRVIVKTGLIRLAAWMPLGLLLGIAVGLQFQDAEAGLAMALQVLYVAIAFQPMAAAIRFAEGANETPVLAFHAANLRRWACSLVTAAITAMFILDAVVLTFLVLTDAEVLRLALALALPVLALLFWAWYAFLLHRGRIDQMTAGKR